MTQQIDETPVEGADDAHAETQISVLPFADLYVSDLNGRTVINETTLASLAENIRDRGLIQNLAGLRDETGRVGIVVGGRRLRALARLQDDPRFQTVPVRVTERVEDARAWAASENFQREAMHPADEIEEYGRMAADGVSHPAIALAFGVSNAHVLRRLKLAGLPSPVLDALRADAITLNVAACFTLCDDLSHALAVLERVSEAPVSETALRRLLKPDSVKSTDRRVLFVGEAAYAEAGGRLTRDLFADETFYDDPNLLETLFDAHLVDAGKALQSAEGWKWVETTKEAYVGWYDLEHRKAARLYPIPGDLSEADSERYEALLDSAQTRELEPDEDAELLVLERVLEGGFSETQKALSGCLIYVSQSGELSVCAGVVAKEDRAAAVAAGLLNASRHVSSDVVSKPDFPANLTEDLGRIARAARQSALLDHPELVLDLLAFQMSGRMGYRTAFGLRDSEVQNWPEKDTGFLPDPRLSLSSSEPKDPWGSDLAKGFRAFRKKGRDSMRAELTRCLVTLLDIEDDRLGALIDKTIGTDIRSIWTPTAEAFFKRVRAPYLDGLYQTLMGLGPDHPTATTFARLKKGEKSERLESLFGDPACRTAAGLSADQHAIIDAWLPET